MSTTNSIKVKAKTLEKYLDSKGYEVKHSHCIEAISIVETGQKYNVAKEKAIRILKENEKLTFKELESANFQVDVVIPIPMDEVLQGIEAINDYASQYITGCEYALCDIGYEVYPYFYDESQMAVRVSGYIEDRESLQYLEDYEHDFEGLNEEMSNKEVTVEKPIGFMPTQEELENFKNEGYE